MNNPPAFQLYADDFLSGTAEMTNEEVGAYIRLLCHSWNKDGLPNDPDRISRMAMGMASPSLGYVIAKFSPSPDGKLRNSRQEKVRAELLGYRQKQSENGKKGANSKWGNGTAIGDANGTAITTPMANRWPNDGSPPPPPPPKSAGAQATPADAHIPTLNEVKAKASIIGTPAESAESFFNHHEGNNLWLNRHGILINWEAKLKAWGERDKTNPKPKTEPQTSYAWKDRKIQDCL